MDVDDALVLLWDAGWDYIDGPGSRVKVGQSNTARRILGCATRRELSTSEYWRTILKLDQDQFGKLLERLGLPDRSTSKKLSKKAIARLRREAKTQHIDPRTGHAVEVVKHVTSAPTPVIDWEGIGHSRPNLNWLSPEEVEEIHYTLVQDYANSKDPISPAGVRSRQILGSAVFRCQTSIGSILKYPTVETSCAALLHALVQDHAFHNGNKRTGLVSGLVALDRNGVLPTCKDDQLFKLVMQIARHQIAEPPHRMDPDMEVAAIATWIWKHSRFVILGDRPLPMRTLRRLLTSHGCVLDQTAGAKVIIRRTKASKGRFWQKKRATETFTTHIHYAGEGREVSPGVIKRIRADLRLSEEYGIDSTAFYSKDRHQVSDFITTYRKTLDRLARR